MLRSRLTIASPLAAQICWHRACFRISFENTRYFPPQVFVRTCSAGGVPANSPGAVFRPGHLCHRVQPSRRGELGGPSTPFDERDYSLQGGAHHFGGHTPRCDLRKSDPPPTWSEDTISAGASYLLLLKCQCTLSHPRQMSFTATRVLALCLRS